MAVTIKVNGAANSLVHKGDTWIAKSTAPDVCKTPSPAGPVPIPYPIIVSMSSDLSDGTTTVKVDGGNMAAIKGCQFTKCSGDEPGTAGGVVSSVNMKEAKFILYSFDVKLDGANACRLTDKMTMNHQNTFCMQGILGTPVSVLEETLKKVAKKCQKEVEDENDARKAAKKKGKSCTSRGKKKHKCCEREMKKKYPNSKRVKSEYRPPKRRGRCGRCRLDIAVLGPNQEVTKIYDFKFNCDDGGPKMAEDQFEKYDKCFACPITLVGP